MKRKREHRDRGEEEQLDEDDLELIGEREPRAPVEVMLLLAPRGIYVRRD